MVAADNGNAGTDIPSYLQSRGRLEPGVPAFLLFILTAQTVRAQETVIVFWTLLTHSKSPSFGETTPLTFSRLLISS